MPYRFAVERSDYSDLASGRVLYSLPGQPALSVRLADEVFRRCLAHWQDKNQTGRVTLYDPCCGAGYHLTALGFLHAAQLKRVIGSDILESVVEVANRNLSLLGLEGLDRRIGEIALMESQCGKLSHREARESALRLRRALEHGLSGRRIATHTFVGDALREGLKPGLSDAPPDIVIVDVPYGQHSAWLGEAASKDAVFNPVARLLENLRASLTPSCIVAIVSDKGQTVAHAAYERLEHFQVGRRRVVILHVRA